MTRAPVIPFALVAALTASIAHADSVAGTRSELLVERSHDIALTMHYGHAEFPWPKPYLAVRPRRS